MYNTANTAIESSILSTTISGTVIMTGTQMITSAKKMAPNI